MTDVYSFQAVTALMLLVSKIILKAYVRWLASNDGIAVLSDGVQGFGIDLAMIGLSLLVGGVTTSAILFSGPGDAIDLLAFFGCFLGAFLLYGGCRKVRNSIVRWGAVTLSWLCGLIPYSGG